jgi:ornithine cyclodeaminase/alanine dehydrogenase-like protein (mu-crystallin family)
VILVTATSSRDSSSSGVAEAGHHVNAVGSNALSRREIDEAAVTRADFIAADSVEQAKIGAPGRCRRGGKLSRRGEGDGRRRRIRLHPPSQDITPRV